MYSGCMYNSQHTVYKTSNGIENQVNIIEQLDGNMSISSSSVAYEPQCECCDVQPECVSTTSTYDPEYDETPDTIPVLVPPLWFEYSERQVPPPRYDEYNPRVTNKKQSQ